MVRRSDGEHDRVHAGRERNVDITGGPAPEDRALGLGRNRSWLFFGSDDHAAAAANLFSLVASCKLHGLGVEAYLEGVIRVMPYRPPDRYLEFAPKYWSSTRARLNPEEMKLPLGHVTPPPPLTAEEQAATG